MNIGNFSRVNFGYRCRLAENTPIGFVPSESVSLTSSGAATASSGSAASTASGLQTTAGLATDVASTAFGLEALGLDSSELAPAIAEGVASVSPASANFSMMHPSVTSGLLSTTASYSPVGINIHKEKPSL